MAERLPPHADAWLRGFAGHTRKAYAADLRDWGRWLAGVDVGVLACSRADVDAYIGQLEDLGRAPATIARRLTTLAGFYGYLIDVDELERSPVRARRPRVDQDSQTLGLDRHELARLLEVAEASGPRDYALCCLLGLNGLRVSEACRADVGDLGHQRGHRTIDVTRKGGKRATLPLAPRTAAAVDELVGDRPAGPLLVTAGGRRVDRHAAAKIVARLARTAAIAKSITPHSLRHTFVTLALDAGAQLRDVQDAAGHADPRTTRRYDRARHSLDRNPTYAVAAHIAE